ncbi:MAG TPA: NAD(P)-dependent oxidoreductase, partial [Terracidiphilus sp.]|nr:NAD(P)-dependent oxidoreductase [Terracidiphilus sp.]
MAEKNTLPLKQRMAISRVCMPEFDATLRSRNFEEVNRGLRPADAALESTRCIECAKPGCVEKCPVGVKVKQVVALIYTGDYLGAAAKLREDNALPAITGRVCPQENQCEGGCVLGRRSAPLAVGHLERFVADYERESGLIGLPYIAPATGKSVAIVGSGPAGLSAAGDLVQKGHRVHVFEALHELGGVLVYGIPEFRLPKSIVREEINNLRRMGVEFETNVVVGKSITIDELMRDENYDAVFVATGAGLPRFLGIPGEHLNGVYSANEFLTRVNLMRAYRALEYDEPVYDCHDRDVMVVGGGNTAMDAVRTARRLGARTATLVYRRSEAEMPARAEEVQHAREEGIEFRMLTDPVAFLGDE